MLEESRLGKGRLESAFPVHEVEFDEPEPPEGAIIIFPYSVSAVMTVPTLKTTTKAKTSFK